MEIGHLGQTKAYMRADSDLKVHNESGEVIGMNVTDEGTRVTLKNKAGETHNVDIRCVSPTKAKKAAYIKALKDVEAVSREGNIAVEVLVKRYNTKVVDIFNAALGLKAANGG